MFVCVCLSTYFNLSISACSKQPRLCTVQGHCGDLGVVMATVELLDLLARVGQPADHRGGRVAADYLQRRRERQRGYQSSKKSLIYFMLREMQVPLMCLLMTLAQPNHSPSFVSPHFNAKQHGQIYATHAAVKCRA